MLRFHSLWRQYPEACFGLVGVATSASEWFVVHSLALVATKVRRDVVGMKVGLVNCPGTCSGDVYSALRLVARKRMFVGTNTSRSGIPMPQVFIRTAAKPAFAASLPKVCFV